MKNIDVHKYLEGFIEYCEKNKIENTDHLMKLAVYDYFNLPAIKDSYSNVAIKNKQGEFSLVLSDDTKLKNFSINIEDNKININKLNYLEESENRRNLLTSETKLILSNIREKVSNSLNFTDLSNALKDFELNDVLKLFSNEDFYILNLAKNYLIETEEAEENIHINITKLISKVINQSTTAISSNISKIEDYKHYDENITTRLDDITIMEALSFNNVNINFHSFFKRSIEDKNKFIKELSNSTGFDKNILGIMLNSKNIVADIVDNIFFDRFKNNIDLKIKIKEKEKTIEDLYFYNPIVENYKNKIIENYPELKMSLNERIEHKIISSEDLGQGIESYQDMLDGINIISKIENENYLSLLFNKPDVSPSCHNMNVSYFVGSDNYNPYYIIQANDPVPFTIDSDALEINHILKSDKIKKEDFEKGLENLYLYCMQKKLSVISFKRNLDKGLGEHLATFIKIKEKYEGIVPTLVSFLHYNKLSLISESDLNFKQLQEIDPFIEKMIKDKLSDQEINSKTIEKINLLLNRDSKKNKNTI